MLGPDPAIPVLTFLGGFLCAVILLSMTARWIFALMSIVKDYRRSEARADQPKPLPWSLILASLLHSGPWALAISGYLAYYLFSHAYASWWTWFFAGLCTGPLLLVAKFLVSKRYRGTEKEADPALAAPLDLVARRKRMIWTTTAVWGGAMWILMSWQVWGSNLPVMF